MTNQNRTSPVVEPDIITLPYRPADSAVPVETFTLSELARRRSERELARHQRIEFELLIWCTSGDAHHEVDFEVIEVPVGNVLHVRAGQVSRWLDRHSYEAQLLLLRPLGQRHVRGHSPVVEPDRDLQRDLAMIVDLIAGDRAAPLSTRGLVAVHELLVARLQLDRTRFDGAGPWGELFVEFEQLIGSRTPPRTVQDAARSIGCSSRTLSRACHAVAGAAPKQLIDDATALEAQRRLSTGTESVGEVAEALGFTEPSNFSRFFQRVVGRTPSAFVGQLPEATSDRSY